MTRILRRYVNSPMRRLMVMAALTACLVGEASALQYAQYCGDSTGQWAYVSCPSGYNLNGDYDCSSMVCSWCWWTLSNNCWLTSFGCE